MNYYLFKESSINLNPSAIIYSKKFKTFIVGTYHFIENDSKEYSKETLHFLNYRIGTLNVFNESNILIHEHHCKLGGIFDLKITDYQNSHHMSYDVIMTAHSNGALACYKFDGRKITLLQEISTGFEMLTIIDDHFNPLTNVLTIFVGSSKGEILCYQYTLNNEISIINCLENKPDILIKEGSITNDSLQIWYLKILNFKFGLELKILLFVTCEDNRWKIFSFENQNLFQIYENKDHSCGVTSLEFFKVKVDDKKNIIQVILLVGSYDEHLRIYNLIITYQDLINVHCNLLKKIHIVGSGIWRILSFKEEIYLSAMYSGAYLLKIKVTDNDFEKHEENSNFDYKLDKFNLPPNMDILIYGIACNEDFTKVFFSSFYSKQNFLYAK